MSARRDAGGKAKWLGLTAVGAIAVLAVMWGPLHSARSAAVSEPSSPKSQMGDQLIRLSRQMLSVSGTPAASELQRCGVLLDLALELDPRNADAWLLRRELARLMDDLKGEAHALAKYCQLRPTDDAAQLDLILTSASVHQTVEERASAVEGVLETPGAKQLSAPLRSRLASYIADAAREMGQQDRFGAWLRTAAQLDPTNKHAAKLVYDLAVDRGAEPGAVGMALLEYIKAAPIDGRARRRLADLMLDHAAYETAADQYQLASALGVTEAPDQFLYRWFLSLAALGRSDQMLALLATLRVGGAGGQAAELPLDLDVLRLAVLVDTGPTQLAQDAFRRIRNTYQARVDKGDISAAMILAWLTALYSPTLAPDFEQAIDALRQKDANNLVAQRIHAWVQMRKGKTSDAEAIFLQLVEGDPFALIGLSRCADAGQTDIKAGYLQKALTMAPANLAGLIAACELRKMGRQPLPQPVAIALTQRLDLMPALVKNPLGQNVGERARPWINVKIDIAGASFDYLQPIHATITLQNTSDLPLALDGEGAAPTRVMVYLTPWQSGAANLQNLPPLVIDARRQIRLEPMGSMTIPIRLDLADFGRVLAASPSSNINFSATVVLNPVPQPAGGMTAGPLGGIDMDQFIERKAMRATENNVDAWLSYIQAPSDPVEHMRLLAILPQLAAALDTVPENAAITQRIVTAINSQFPQLHVLGQAWLLATMPTDAALLARLAPVQDLAQRSDDPLVRILYLARFVKDAKDPAVAAALRHQDPLIAGFARTMQ
ncbi:MAG: hypothetical protein IT440_03715 [Phycisphaeraceae bacterium]|nr:hypothetical protein [Phycisphaeraceae bacterium]